MKMHTAITPIISTGKADKEHLIRRGRVMITIVREKTVPGKAAITVSMLHGEEITMETRRTKTMRILHIRGRMITRIMITIIGGTIGDDLGTVTEGEGIIEIGTEGEVVVVNGGSMI